MYNTSDYMVNKGQKVRHNGKAYVYGDDLPTDLVIQPSWVEQRILIVKKEIKEEKIKSGGKQ
jgi:hypothetical protein